MVGSVSVPYRGLLIYNQREEAKLFLNNVSVPYRGLLIYNLL